MAELPDLEIIREMLIPLIVDVPITSAEVRRPWVMRNLVGGEPAEHLAGWQFTGVNRRGKFLLLPLSSGVTLVIHPMLAGRLRYGKPLSRHRKRDALVLGLADGHELRYHDAKDMGKLYLVDDLSQVPTFDGLGPDANDSDLLFIIAWLVHSESYAEIKRVLTTQSFVAGIGNAYSDEILWRAGIYPMRRRTSLSEEEVARLYQAMREVLSQAIETLRARVGSRTDLELRDFMMVHGKAGQPCPRCAGTISKVTRERRTTNFCRTCQPGLMISRL